MALIYQIHRQKTLLNSMNSANSLSWPGHSSFLLSGRLVILSASCHLDSEVLRGVTVKSLDRHVMTEISVYRLTSNEPQNSHEYRVLICAHHDCSVAAPLLPYNNGRVHQRSTPPLSQDCG